MILGIIGLLVLVGISDAGSILTVAPLVDLLIHPDMENISPISRQWLGVLERVGIPIGFVWLLMVFWLFNLIQSAILTFTKHLVLRLKYSFLRVLMYGTFSDFFHARWRFFSTHKHGELFNTFVREINGVAEAIYAMGSIFAASTQMLLYLIVPFYISWKVTLASLSCALLLAVPFVLLGKISYRFGRINTQTANETVSVIQESLQYAKIVLGFANREKALKDLAKAFDAHRQSAVKAATVSLFSAQMYVPVGIFVVVLALFTAQRIGVAISESIALLYSLFKFVPKIGEIARQKTTLDSFVPSYEQIMRLRGEAAKLIQTGGGRVFNGFEREIRFENVVYSHPGFPPALNDITLRIPKGDMVAIVGRSGAGKTTLIDVLAGFYTPDQGTVTFDGVPIHEFDIRSYRKKIGYVPQDSVLLNRTVRENLLWADENAGDSEIREAARLANAHDFVQQLPQQYDTLVGDRGMRLSGGQVQRLALARAIIRRPDILILDEATSSLDTESERLIQKALEEIARKTTLVVVAHRLSTIINADFIYVFDRGRIAEAGTYEQLLKQNGLFARMVDLQMVV